jgi:predicted ArsR family transcriptional regulator
MSPMSTATVGYSAISSYSRVEILHLIQEQPRRTILELQEATDLHPNTIREHLARLISDGFIVAEKEHRTTRGRPRVLYSAADGDATRSAIQRRKVRDAAQRGDLMRRVLTVDVPDVLETRALHQLDALVEELEDEGFDPIIDDSALTVDLTPCAHATAQADHREVLCSVHLSLLQGVLTEAGGPLAVDGMRSSCDPSVCIIQLLHAATAHD